MSGCGDSGTAAPTSAAETSAETTISRESTNVPETAATDAVHLTEPETAQEDSGRPGAVQQTKVRHYGQGRARCRPGQ